MIVIGIGRMQTPFSLRLIDMPKQNPQHTKNLPLLPHLTNPILTSKHPQVSQPITNAPNNLINNKLPNLIRLINPNQTKQKLQHSNLHLEGFLL